jgi:O-antigen/teichoic acid export membrane protein
MISIISTSTDVGLYGAASYLLAPAVAAIQHLNMAIFPFFVKTEKNKAVKKRKIFFYSMIAGIIVFIGASIISLFSKPIILTIFGSRFEGSIEIFSVLIFITAIGYIVIPFSNALQAAGKEMLILKVVWIPPLANIFCNLIFFHFFGLIGIAYSTLVVTSSYLIIMAILYWVGYK